MMQTVIQIMILLGSVLMIWNIIEYKKFMGSSSDVMMAGGKRNSLLQIIAFILLIFFLVGYALVGIFGRPDLMMAGILFGGSVFVSIVLTLMFRLVYTVKERSIEITEAIISVVEARDPNLNGHSRSVQNLCMLFYKYLPPAIKSGISPVSLEYAALLHDVGKLGVPESILNKPGKLTDEEWKIMRRHPKIALDILKSLPSFNAVQNWILYHHERMDGKGYYELAPEDIPVEARIISICDTYSAVTMRRSYKPPLSYEAAVEIIKSVSGTQLDSDLVEIFLSIPKEELEACAPEVVEL